MTGRLSSQAAAPALLIPNITKNAIACRTTRTPNVFASPLRYDTFGSLDWPMPFVDVTDM